jgi:hypothetical protein
MIGPERREQVLHQAIKVLTEDVRVAGVMLIGSGTDGFIDELSDIDLLAVTNDADDVEPLHADWEQAVRQHFPVLHHAKSPYTEAHHLHIFILDGLLEIDTSFVALTSLQPAWDRGRVVFDRSGAVSDRLRHAEPAEVQDRLWLLDQACHRVLECRKALYRGKPWQASLVLDELRSFTAQLAGLVQIESNRQRDADRLSHAFLEKLSDTVVPVDEGQMREALRLLATMMLDQAEQLYVRAGIEFPNRFAWALLTSLDTGIVSHGDHTQT